ncbi:MAG: DUF4386 domain-containing protein [Candidatus Zixiibacteriota bacterium]
MNERYEATSLKRYARIAGILYLIIIICAGFAEGGVRSVLIVPGDATATANNILSSEGLYRFGFVCDLIAFISDAAVAILLYALLKPVNKTVALVASTLRIIAHPAIGSINLLNHLAPLNILTNPDFVSAFTVEQLQNLAMQFLTAHYAGYLIAGAFFGVHCAILGYLLYKSELFPQWLGIFLIVASIGYVIESFGNFLFPAYKDIYSWIVVIPAVIAELSLCLWLLIKGIRTSRAA